ncbi:MAG: nitroreductase family protein [Bacteroidales bacterium]|nr:nitroreductase family protein [Bacteroidales bacterium]
MISSLTNHRSIRRYTDKDISRELLAEILKAGIRASNTGNMQLYSVVVTRDAALKRQLAPAHFNQPMITNAPVVLTFCADINRFVKWCRLRNANVGFDNAETLVSAIIDTSLFAQNVCLSAEEHGLGVCYLGTTTYNPDQIIRVLNLPKGVMPITTVSVGFPAETPELTSRLPLNAVVHDEQYHDYSDADIENAYLEMEKDPKNQVFIQENKKENLAQVFAEVRYAKESNEHFSQVLLDTLKQQGMI